MTGAPPSPIRVGLIGARRVRMGLGPFVAREFVRAGSSLESVVGTARDSVTQACRDLETQLGRAVRGYTDFEAMLEAETLDAVAILSPSETHGFYLRKALAAGLDVFCEKPLLWGEADLGGEAERLLASFQTQKLVLWENCLWPVLLPAYFELFPTLLGVEPNSFTMKLAPTDAAAKMLGELLPHPLSLLQAIAPVASAQERPRLAAIRFSHRDLERPDLELSFRYLAGAHALDVRLVFQQRRTQVPEVGFGINGYDAVRRVEPKSYRMEFCAGARAVELPDPLATFVADFLVAVRTRDLAREAVRKAQILERQILLAELCEAFRDA